MIVIVEEAAKPVPETVTVEPVEPDVGFNVIDAVVEKFAEVECEEASVAMTV